MEKIVVNGGKQLYGEINISGAKNAVLAILPATILAQDICRIENLPDISDVKIMVDILSLLGAQVKYINRSTIEVDTRFVNSSEVPYDYAKQMRASYYFIGALLGRFSKASVAMPGGCFFGVRPIDQHIKGFEALGCTVNIENAIVDASVDGNMYGSSIYMDVVSVGATMNIMLAAVKARGLTIIENAAKEPHIVDLANFLNTMGADIRGAGTDVIKIRGVEELHGCTYSVVPDQIEAGTYMVAVAATGGNVLINHVIPKHLESITSKLEECGIIVEEDDESVRIISNRRPKKCTVKTMPHPGFPTDMQPQMAVLLTLAEGTSIISESVWDSRFRYIEQLLRFGAKVQVNGNLAVIEGVEQLKGAPVKAVDLRAGAAMIIAGLCAEGKTEIEDIKYIDRGYEDVVEKLQNVGADIRRVEVKEPQASVVSAG
ncbi:MAG: UDP-N-acetylglucosamine 1-carboxyvinyltransferase [Clostridia bacterium]|nr:UDP-N-acetylglucosamine 1-carboxyvinyltransferase [Clostridia bacterium]